MYIFRVNHINIKTLKKETTNYTDEFEELEDAEKWYNNFGKRLEKIFNRKLFLNEVRKHKNKVKYYSLIT